MHLRVAITLIPDQFYAMSFLAKPGFLLLSQASMFSCPEFVGKALVSKSSGTKHTILLSDLHCRSAIARLVSGASGPPRK